MITTIILALARPVAAPVPATASLSVQASDRIVGRWVGEFAGADWTFELTRTDAGWSGRYQSSRAQTWRALEEVSVTGDTARFSLKSQPRLTFILTPDAAGATLAGNVEIDGVATLPFTAKRAA